MKADSESEPGIERKPLGRFKGFLLKLAFLGVSLLVALLIGELLVRLLLPQNIVPRYVESADWGIRKNIGGVSGRLVTDEFDHEFTTNSRGFRGQDEYEIPKPDKVYRVIVLGDSVALGHGVGDDETFSEVLERKLSERFPCEVINMGVSGFGTAEQLIQLEEVALEFDPDLVVLGYFTNDPYNNVVCKLYTLEDGELKKNEEAFVPAIATRDRLYKIPGYTFLSQHSHLVNLLRGKASAYFTRKLGEEAGVADTSGRNVPDEAVSLTKALLEKLSEVCRENELPLVILDIPLFRGGERTNNLPLDPASPPAGSRIVSVADEVYGDHPVEELTFPTDCHPTPTGHRLMGDWLADLIGSESEWSGFPASSEN
ncbi:MAG: GDSL-type esterase/lipase family protein [Verrucomicrobiota bacterium]